MGIEDLIKEKMYCDTISRYISVILDMDRQLKEKAEKESKTKREVEDTN